MATTTKQTETCRECGTEPVSEPGICAECLHELGLYCRSHDEYVDEDRECPGCAEEARLERESYLRWRAEDLRESEAVERDQFRRHGREA